MTLEPRGFERGFNRGIGAREVTQTTTPPLPATAPTALQTRILNMPPLTWERHLTGETGLDAALNDTGTDDGIVLWCNKGPWNPNDESAYLIGGDHNKQGGGGDTERLVKFVASDDAWQIVPSKFDNDAPNPNHPYDTNTMDWKNAPGYMYYQEHDRWRVDVDPVPDANWDDPGGEVGGRAWMAQDFFPGKGIIRVSTDEQIKLDTTSNPLNTTWVPIGTKPYGLIEAICVCSPVLRKVLFGGGTDGSPTNHYLFHDDETITGPFTPPFGNLNCHQFSSTIVTADPITGVFLVVEGANPNLWKFDGTTWTLLATPAMPSGRSGNMGDAVVWMCCSYGGIIICVRPATGAPFQMWVYRHAIAFGATVTDEST